jgi:hypothetical protein
VRDLSSLRCLKTIHGDLIVESTSALPSLDGLEGLRDVRWSVYIGGGCEYCYGNAALRNVDALDGLETIGGDLYLRVDCDSSDCERGSQSLGLDALTSVHDVTLRLGEQFGAISGLSALKEVALLEVFGDAVETISGFRSLETPSRSQVCRGFPSCGRSRSRS